MTDDIEEEVTLESAADTPATSRDSSPETEGRTVAAKKGSAKKGAKKGAKKSAAKSEGKKGRPGQFSGKRITKLVSKNPRREGTSGAASWDLIKSGMTYEAYLAAGGVRRDLEWDLAHDWVKVS
jgi:hypothetical protein